MDEQQWMDLAEEAGQLREALRTRGPIEQAKGVIMGLRRCSPDDAYAELAEMSRNHNIKVHDIARALARYAAEGIRTVPVDDREMKIALLVAERWVTHLPGGVNPARRTDGTATETAAN
ncbi:MAG: ANTAR domain-containing protein [Angustibacter sp.]